MPKADIYTEEAHAPKPEAVAQLGSVSIEHELDVMRTCVEVNSCVI